MYVEMCHQATIVYGGIGSPDAGPRSDYPDKNVISTPASSFLFFIRVARFFRDIAPFVTDSRGGLKARATRGSILELTF